LRTQWGCDLAWLQAQHGYDVQQVHGPYLQQLMDRQLVVIQGACLLLTPQGKLLADTIAMNLFVD